MKKLIIATGLLLGFAGFAMAQAPSIAKTKTSTHPAKMVITKNPVTPAKTTSNTVTKTSPTQIKKTTATTQNPDMSKKTTSATQKSNKKAIYKKHHKKLHKTTKPGTNKKPVAPVKKTTAVKN